MADINYVSTETEQASSDHFSVAISKLRKKNLSEICQKRLTSAGISIVRQIEQAKPGSDQILDNAWLVKTADDGHMFVLWGFSDPLDKYELHCRLAGITGEEPDYQQWHDIITFIQAETAFWFGINWYLGKEQKAGFRALESLNYKNIGIFEGYLNLSQYEPRRDALVLRITSFDRIDTGCALISFPRGFLAITGSIDYITGLSFLKPGEEIKDEKIRWQAQYLGLMDNKGRLLPANERTIYNSARDSRIIGQKLPDIVINAADQLEQYFKGKRQNFDLELDIRYGSEFQQKVWKALMGIPYGVTVTYEDLAKRLTEPGQIAAHLARAVGSACAANPLPVIIPCHRVIGKNGRLVGFNGGIDVKEYLLNHEIFGI